MVSGMPRINPGSRAPEVQKSASAKQESDSKPVSGLTPSQQQAMQQLKSSAGQTTRKNKQMPTNFVPPTTQHRQDGGVAAWRRDVQARNQRLAEEDQKSRLKALREKNQGTNQSGSSSIPTNINHPEKRAAAGA